jgi:predicted DNA-binding transcriptional regulator AlpA
MTFYLPKGQYIIQGSITTPNGKTTTFSRPATSAESEKLDLDFCRIPQFPKPTRSTAITETEIITWAAMIRYTKSCRQTIKRLSIYEGFPKPKITQVGKRKIASWSKAEVDNWINQNPWPNARKPSWP